MTILESSNRVLSIRQKARSATPDTAANTQLRIGTSGWHYGSWRGPFYPKEVKIKELLSFYASRFDTAEINNSFYRLPTVKAIAEWRETVPEGFVFAWKASRFMTHFRRLKDCEDSIEMVFGRMAGLGPAFGPVLFQLPPQMKVDRERLASFLLQLPREHRYTFEFRDESWYEPAIFALLSDHNIALCISDHAAAPAPPEATADFVYVRGHGTDGRYAGSYPDDTLSNTAKAIDGWRKEGRDVFVYFDNDQKSAAPKDAERLVAITSD